MLFNSYEFLIFAPIALLVAAVLRGAALRIWLVVMSYIFYGWARPEYCLLLLASTVLDFCVGLRLGETQNPRARKWLVAASVCGNIGMLAVFKYMGFFMSSLDGLLGLVGQGGRVPVPNLALPIGISFYTFQTLSYTIDVYRGKMPPTRSFTTMALYVAFFPQLVAGPIERADRLMPQLAQRRRRDPDDVLAGMTRIFWGLLKKVVFADWLATYANLVYDSPYAGSQWDLLLGTWAFAFQIYLDFSAYSDIAIGLALTLGIRLEENFRWPYLARNVSEFWRRWHISLSTWLRDYLYIPLGGSRRGAWSTAGNVLVVMFLGGLWHGADWKFVIWGLWHGVGLAIVHAWSLTGRRPADENTPLRFRHIPAILLTFHFVLLSWIFFRAGSISDAGVIFRRLFTDPWPAIQFRWPISDIMRPGLILLAAVLAHVVRGLGWTRRITTVRNPVAIGACWGLMVLLIALLFAPVAERFIYFQF